MFPHLGDDLAAYGAWFLFVVVVPALILYNLIVAPLSRAIRRRKDRRRREVGTDFPTDPQLPDPGQ